MRETVEVWVEIPQGGGVRRRVQPRGDRLLEEFPGTDVVPALAMVAYGCILGTHNPADGGALDAYILGAEGELPGSTLTCKVLGIRLRNNGDHKVLVVPVTAPLSRLDEAAQLPDSVLEVLAKWDETQTREGETWGDRNEGLRWVQQLQR